MKEEKKSGKYRTGTGIFLLLFLLSGVFCGEAEAAEKQPEWKKGAGVAAYLEPEGEIAEDKTAEDNQEQQEKAHSAAGEESADRPADESQNLVMAHVHNVLNVRESPDTQAQLAGYLYADCGGTILERKDGWTKLESGELTGWASDDYLLFGQEAKDAAENAGRTVAKTMTGALRIRKAPSLDAGVYDLLEEGAEYEVVDEKQLAFSDGITISDEWVAVDYGGKTGFVSAEYVQVEFLVDHGETVEQVEARREKERKAAEAEKEAQKEAVAAEKKEKQQKEIEKAKTLSAADDLLLGALIQCEAKDEPYEGQVAVGAVVMNRVKSSAYPNTIQDVIFASGQFTPAGSGQLGRIVSSGKVKDSCLAAAREAIAGSTPVGTAAHFRRAGSREGIVIGHHVFW